MMHAPTKLQALDELRKGKQWVCFDKSKVPINPFTLRNAMSNKPGTWETYDVAETAYKADKERFLTTGRMFLKEQKITGIDLDKCIDEHGKLSLFGEDIVSRLNSYTEYSPSGRGLHIWVHGNIPKALAPSKYDGTNRVEMYDCERGFTVTGDHYKGTPTTIEDREEILLIIHSEITARRQEAKQEKPRAAPLPKITQTHGDTFYGLKALKDECAILASTPEGGRNVQLNRSAYSLGQLVAGHELSRSTVERELSSAAAQVGLDAREIESTLRSGIDAGMQSPRSAPAPQPQTATNGNGNALHDNLTARGEDTSPFYLTDLGNAERFKAKHGHKVRWCETWNKWAVFNGKCWEIDRSGQVDQLAKTTVRAIYQEATPEENNEQRKKIAKHAVASESSRAIRAMLDRAKSELPIIPEAFNRHLHLINCNNGTLDLKTGELPPHEAKDFLTRCIKIDYNPFAPCNEWKHFLYTIFAGDCDLITLIHRALGMSLSGDTSEQCLFICHGNGSNGKTTMLEAVRIIMAGYGLAANIETFQIRKNETVRNDIAEMYGARLVTASENTMGSRLNEAFIKKATGKDPLRARRLHENEFEFMPEFTLWLAVNHKPVVKDTTKGMWRRVQFIPFNVTLEREQIDKHLGDKLLEESEGILAWLVQGCIAWYQHGYLTVPDIVKDATQAYREEMDILSIFLSERCEEATQETVGATALYEAYKTWCEQNGERYETKTSFGLRLAERGYEKAKTRTGIEYKGLKLLSIENPVTSV